MAELSEVASIYLLAARDGKPPAKAVAEQFEVSPRTAGVWIARARDAGLLPNAHGLELKRNWRALKVANRLGIPYDDLVQAIRDEVGGDLRV